jgi:type I restriction enzyme M protein
MRQDQPHAMPSTNYPLDRAMTKEQQRAELHKTIWRIANDLRGSVDGWDFKGYVLGLLFYRFISEHLTQYLNGLERETGTCGDFDYADLL